MQSKKFTLLRTLASVALVLASVFAVAQPTLTSANFPQVGDEFNRINANPSAILPGAAGANVFWNFASLVPTSGATSGTHVAPNTTTMGSMFPTSDVANISGTFVAYYDVTSSASSWVGADNNGTAITFSDPLIQLTYPFTYSSTFSDIGDRQYNVGAIVGSRLTRDVIADGYGTLTLPNGNYENVLRVRIEETYRDTTPNPAQYFERESIRYEWYDEASRYPLLVYETGTTNQSGTIANFSVLNYAFVLSVADDYGYSYITSDEGLNCEWVDITDIGTEITGLADDNFVGPIPMGIDFQYYWTTENQVYIGSNGYVAFDDIQISSVGTVAFSFIPTPDERNNFVAPCLADLTFGGVNNPGKCYVYNDADRFIVTYLQVPQWTNNTFQWVGSNTFQVIFSALDSSITFNYLAMEPNLTTEYATSQNPVMVGIENITGDIGIQVSNTAMPPSNSCLRFDPPNVPLIDVKDVAPTFNQNPENGGFFVFKNEIFNLQTNVKNVGSIDVSTPITVNTTVFDPSGMPFVIDSEVLPGLSQGQSELVTFDTPFPALFTGSYTYEVSTTTTDDINPNNDFNVSELVVVDSLPNGEIMLSYVVQTANQGAVSWTGGAGFNDGAGIYVEPPFYPVNVIGAEYYVATTDAVSGFRAKVQDDNGPANSPGLSIASKDVDPAQVLSLSWNRVNFDAPPRIDDGGIYVSWLMGAGGIQLATELDPPYSRRSYEILGDAWAPYRSGDASDLYIRVIVKKTDFPVGISTPNNSGFTLQEAYPNPSTSQALIEYTLPVVANVAFTLTDITGRTIEHRSLNNMQAGSHNIRVNTSELPSGVYLYTISSNGHTVTKRLMVAN